MAEKLVNLRALRNEAAWLPETLEDANRIISVLRDAGVPDQQVNAMVGWLVAKANGQPDRSEKTTRARYRKVLAELHSPLTPSGVAQLAA